MKKKKIEQKQASISGDFNFNSIDIDEFLNFAAQIRWSNGSTFDATIKLQGSNDNSNWTDLTNTSQAISGASGTHIWDFANTALSFVRISVTGVTGSADLELDFSAKQPEYRY